MEKAETAGHHYPLKLEGQLLQPQRQFVQHFKRLGLIVLGLKLYYLLLEKDKQSMETIRLSSLMYMQYMSSSHVIYFECKVIGTEKCYVYLLFSPLFLSPNRSIFPRHLTPTVTVITFKSKLNIISQTCEMPTQ